MADVDQGVSAVAGVTQRWKEFATGIFGRLQCAVLYALNGAGTETALVSGASGGLVVEDAGASFDAGNTHAPADNTAAVLTYAQSAGVKHQLGGVAWSYDSDPTGGLLSITDAGATVFSLYITSKGPGFIPFNPPLQSAAANTALVITLAAGGETVQGTLNVLGYRQV